MAKTASLAARKTPAIYAHIAVIFRYGSTKPAHPNVRKSIWQARERSGDGRLEKIKPSQVVHGDSVPRFIISMEPSRTEQPVAFLSGEFLDNTKLFEVSDRLVDGCRSEACLFSCQPDGIPAVVQKIQGVASEQRSSLFRLRAPGGRAAIFRRRGNGFGEDGADYRRPFSLR